MVERGLSKAQFAKECKIDISVLNKVLINDFHIRTDAIFKIAKVMNIYVHKLFIDKEK